MMRAQQAFIIGIDVSLAKTSGSGDISWTQLV
jgi:hypothetical protein